MSDELRQFFARRGELYRLCQEHGVALGAVVTPIVVPDGIAPGTPLEVLSIHEISQTVFVRSQWWNTEHTFPIDNLRPWEEARDIPF